MLSNNPPSPIEFAKTVIAELNDWLANTPVIQTEDEAREIKPLLDRSRAALLDIEQERVVMVAPLNEQVARINADHKLFHNTDKSKPGSLDRVLNVGLQRVQAFMLAEEVRRKKEAEDARKAAEEAERIAREAEAREAEAHDNAASGEVDIDIAEATQDADVAFMDYKKASRFAAVAEKNTKVKVAGGFGRSISIKNKEILTVTDWSKALSVMGLTEKISEAICSSARDFRKEFDELPSGVTATYERSI